MGTSATNPRNVVFLHGFMGCGQDWDGVATRLGDGFQCLQPDLPGHGGDTRDIPAPEEGFAVAINRLLAAMDNAEMDTAALVGYSMGGRIALAAALQAPARFTHLIVESASPGIEDDAQRAERLRHDTQLADHLESVANDPGAFEQFLRDWYAMPLFGSLQRHPDLLESLIRKRRENDPARLAAALRALSVGRQPDFWPALPRLAMPTLVIVGAVDRKYRLISEEMTERCPRVAIHEMTGCGHNVHAENPDAYTTVLRSFLEASQAPVS
jgi:2-succinyl-6-hydroxy-2,4-cyclohexadiene-1-carboxylate synthase